MGTSAKQDNTQAPESDMAFAEYKLPFGVHESLEPVQTGTTPDTKDSKGNTIKGKPIYAYKTVRTREPKTLAAFGREMVNPDNPEEHVRKLAQGQWDIQVQRIIRETDVDDIFSGKDENGKPNDYAGLTEEEKVEHALARLQDVADAWRYGSTRSATGGQTAAAKKALAKENAVKAAAAANPEVAAKLAEYEKMLADLGIQS